jgi:hypothetical protein
MPPRLVPPDALACCLERQRTFFFVQEVFLDIPRREWKILLVAHELAHAYLFEDGDDAHVREWPDDCEGHRKMHEEKEAGVSRVLEQWGFDTREEGSLKEWARTSGLGLRDVRM